MLIKIKNLQRHLYTVKIEPEKLVYDLKKAIFTECSSNYSIGSQKLIYDGLILEDNRTIESYCIKDDKFVIIIQRPTIDNYDGHYGVTKVVPPLTLTADHNTKMLTESINNLCASKIIQLTQAQSADPLKILRSQPEFIQLKTILQKNPDQIFPALQLIGKVNPELLQILSNNQETFLNFLYEEEDLNSSVAVSSTNIGSDNELNCDNSDDDISSDRAIVITDEDQAAIERLLELGFPEHLVVQAYIACDRNEVLAANFLFFDFGD